MCRGRNLLTRSIPKRAPCDPPCGPPYQALCNAKYRRAEALAQARFLSEARGPARTRRTALESTPAPSLTLGPETLRAPPSMIYRLLADLIVVAHFAFLAFVVAGGLLLLRWPKLAWVH